MLKRITLFMMVNLLVVVTISLVLSLFQVTPYLQSQGINYGSLMVFCLIWGMGGSLISLLLSRVLAKKMMGVTVLVPNQVRENYEIQLIAKVYTLARKAGLTTMPEVGVYESPEINAFATGPSKNRSLVAVSSGLLLNLSDEEVEGVLAHEVAHVANGDMVTMTLLQGIINAFVMFLARIAAHVVHGLINKNSNSNSSRGFMYFMMVWVFEMILMVLGTLVVCWFSRYREYRADAGGAKLTSSSTMIKALQAVSKNKQVDQNSPPAIAAFKINGVKMAHLFSTHPPMAARIEALRKG